MPRLRQRRWPSATSIFLSLALFYVFALLVCPVASNEAKDMYDQALIDYGAGRFQQAERAFTILSKHLTELPELVSNIAVCQDRQGRGPDAVRTLDQGIARMGATCHLQLALCRQLASMLNHHAESYELGKRSRQDVLVECVSASSICRDADDVEAANSATATTSGVLTLLGAFNQAAEMMHENLPKLPYEDAQQMRGNLALTLLRGGQSAEAWEEWETLAETERWHTGSQELSPATLLMGADIREIGWPRDVRAMQMRRRALQETVESVLEPIKGACDSGDWTLSYNWTAWRTRVKTQPLELQLLNPDSAYQTYGTELPPRFKGPPMDGLPYKFHERSVHLVHLKSAYLLGVSAIVASNCVFAAGSHGANLDIQNLPRPKSGEAPLTLRIGVPVFSVLQHQLRNYFHFLLEALPRILWFKRYVKEARALDKVKLLLPAKGKMHAYMWSALKLFGLQEEDCVHYTDHLSAVTHVEAGLWLIDWAQPMVDTHGTLANDLWSVFWPPREAILSVRTAFHNALREKDRMPPKDAPWRVVWVSRPSGKLRSIPNEASILALLRKTLGADRVVVHTGSESLLEQVKMFVPAKVVIGAHGAGLANFVFTREDAVLMYFPMDPHVEACFSHLASALGQPHYLITNVPLSYYYGTYKIFSREHMGNVVNSVVEVLADEFGIDVAGRNEL